MAHFGFTLSWDAKKYKPHLIAALHPCKLGRLDFQQNLKVVSGTLFWGIWFPDLITTTLRVTDQRLARYKWARKIHLYTPTWLQKLHRPKIHMPKNPKHELSKKKNLVQRTPELENCISIPDLFKSFRIFILRGAWRAPMLHPNRFLRWINLPQVSFWGREEKRWFVISIASWKNGLKEWTRWFFVTLLG